MIMSPQRPAILPSSYQNENAADELDQQGFITPSGSGDAIKMGEEWYTGSRKLSPESKRIAITVISGILLVFFGFHPKVPTNESVGSGLRVGSSNNGREPNPPYWPNSIRIFQPNQTASEIAEHISALTSNATNLATGHFSDKRYAFLFHPGQYDFSDQYFEVGFYVQVNGLGSHATDTQFLNGGPRCSAMDKRLGGAGSLDTFWRSMENLRITDSPETNFRWAVSQAAPLRRMQIDGNLDLFEGYCINSGGIDKPPNCGAYFASGGFMANVNVDGYVNFGSQQQFLSRNVNFNGGSGGGAWNLVFVGCNGDELEKKNPWDGPDLVRTVDDEPRVRVEKPYIVADTSDPNQNERYKLVVPKAIVNAGPTTWTSGGTTGVKLSTSQDDDIRDFEYVRLVRSDFDSYESIQGALDEGLDVVFAPGIYRLERTLVVRHPGTVLLGLGMATLVAPKAGSPILHIKPRVSNVRVAGLLLEAAVLAETKPHYVDSDGFKAPRSSLLIWGSPGLEDPGDGFQPGVLSDIFCRVGGTTVDARFASVEVMIQIHSGNVVGDHLWLWRNDHLAAFQAPNQGESTGHSYAVRRGECSSTTGLEVTGDDVTIYGLSAEHFTGDMIIWRGERGQVRFYQSELPYEVTQEEYGNHGYVSYLVDEHTQTHEMSGGGVYSFFADYNVSVHMAFRHPSTVDHGVNMTNVFTRFLNGHGSVQSVVNGKGDAVTAGNRLSRVEFSA